LNLRFRLTDWHLPEARIGEERLDDHAPRVFDVFFGDARGEFSISGTDGLGELGVLGYGLLSLALPLGHAEVDQAVGFREQLANVFDQTAIAGEAGNFQVESGIGA
jgi:hypothetical protein